MSVIQGSILGPILFLIHIDDLPASSLLEAFLFADDTQGLKAGKKLSELMDSVNLELAKWAQWFRSNKMAVNTDKTKYLIFHTKGKKFNLNGKKLVFDNNDPLNPFNPSLVHELERIHDNHDDPSSHSYKLLGILFDEHLTFNHHINLLKSKLSKALFCMNRIKNYVPQKTLKTLFPVSLPPPLLPTNCELLLKNKYRKNLHYAKKGHP